MNETDRERQRGTTEKIIAVLKQKGKKINMSEHNFYIKIFFPLFN